jgi:hypothetical protein
MQETRIWSALRLGEQCRHAGSGVKVRDSVVASRLRCEDKCWNRSLPIPEDDVHDELDRSDFFDHYADLSAGAKESLF